MAKTPHDATNQTTGKTTKKPTNDEASERVERAYAEWKKRRAKRTPAQRRARLITVAVLVLVLGGIGLWQVTWLNGVVTSVLGHPVLWLAVALVVAVISIGRRLHRSGVAALLVFGLVGAGVWYAVTAAHRSNRAVDAALSVTSEAMPSYQMRAPLDVVAAQTPGHITITGKPDRTRYLPTTGKYGALAELNSAFSGYGQVVWQTVTPDGQTSASNCNFDASASRKLGGLLTHNLNRSIIRAAGFGTMVDERDAYGYCDASNQAVAVFPITKYTGFWAPHRVPAGVVVMDHTGKLSVKRTVATGELPGPVYPVTLSIAQRTATRAVDSWWRDVRGVAGYQDTQADEGDPNAGNNADFMLLQTTSQRADYVTPLTLKGGAAAIAAVGVVSMDHVTAGELNPLTVHTLPVARQANSAVAGRIRSDYAELPWASGMGVYEIAPTGPSAWVATLGQRNGIQYRVLLNADQSSCLTDPRGAKLWCVKDGQRVGTAGGTGGTASATITVPPNLTGLSDAQLAALAQQLADAQSKVAAEQVKRAK